MAFNHRKGLAVLTVVLMCGISMLPALSGHPSGGVGEGRGITPLDGEPVWSDTLDDLSKVYVPVSGLVGVEVSGGNAHLKAGFNDGWVATEVITCPPGLKYDLLVVEVDAPGASWVKVSVLNASADPTEIGFANETLGGFKLLNQTDVILYSIDQARFPELRVQASLHADGTDRPLLLGWSLYYIGLEEWRDDFRGTSKMSDFGNLNFTDDTLEVDLSAGASGGGPGVGDYEVYPTIAIAGYYDVDILYPNTGHTGYEDPVSIDGTYVNTVDFSDLNQDGFLDLLVGDRSEGTLIYWGALSGTYSAGSKTTVTTSASYGAAAGDFNGDGWQDVAIVGYGTNSWVFLNDGSGDFGASADITISGTNYNVGAGDVNGDGFDDMILGYSSCDVYYGGPSGPGTSPDESLGGYLNTCEDLDRDGYDDVITRSSSSMRVYMGGYPDIDSVADYTLSGTGSTIYYPDAGDLNGDGYIDIAGSDYIGPGNVDIIIFEGGSDGWTSSRVHKIDTDYYGRAEIADLDKDGYEDLIFHTYVTSEYRLKIYPGKSTWPSTASMSKSMSYAYDIAVAIPEGETVGPRAYRGTFTTEMIRLPDGKKWDMVYLDGTFPQNTSATISVLDATGSAIAGFKDLRRQDVDLSGLVGSANRDIKIKISLESEFNTTTPVLDSLTVKWMDTRVWRDEFYGDSKVERMLNLYVTGGMLAKGALGGSAPDLIFPSLLGDANYTTSPLAFTDAGGLDYLSTKPFDFSVRGTTAADTADVDGDGYLDLVFAMKRTGLTTFATRSPLFMGGPLGLKDAPDHRFETTGATGVLLRDLDGDGRVDVVFSQERKSLDDYSVESILYWGSASGWSDTPDVRFSTKGASGVEAVDVDGDGLLDLVFSCYRDPATSTDSMVFLQDAAGIFNGSSPDHRLPTKGAQAVAAGDLDGDGRMDLVFANNLSGGFTEIDSYVYWGRSGGGFETTPLGLPTSGAMGVEVADVDGDGDLDIVFANHWDNSQRYDVDSYVYLNDGAGGFGSSPAARLPTVGATGVAAVDLDGTGRLDLVFSCQRDATTYQVPSLVFLGGASGWSSSPDIELPTEGAYAVVAARLVEYGSGGYLSRPIILDDQNRDTGTVHTFRYSAMLGGSISATILLVDATTWEVLGEASVQSGDNEWDVRDLFHVKEHPVMRVMLVTDGLGSGGTFTLDDLWLNWTKRVRTPPSVVDLSVSAPSVLRLQSVTMRIEVADDYDPAFDLVLNVEHRVNGSTAWLKYLVGTPTYSEAEGAWLFTITPKTGATVGLYDFRVDVTDTDMQYVDNVEFPGVLEVLNNIPTAPAVHIAPAKPSTTSQLRVEFDARSTDLETAGLEYLYRWYRDGVLVEDLTEDLVPSFQTSKGENWSVEVSSWDGDDESPPALASVLIGNAAPLKDLDLPDAELDEDTADSEWLDLSTAFKDDDGDALTWSLASVPEHLDVTIDPVTGKVTLAPEADWFGQVDVTFVASDGVDTAMQTVTVTVRSVNDIPVITSVDGKPVTSGTLTYSIKQGDMLVITYEVSDVEGDTIRASVNTTAVEFDENARTITFEPGNEAVGTLRFGLWISDDPANARQVTLNFVIVVENENDPMDDPTITSPWSGEKFKVNQSFSLIAICNDPDIPFGQVLNFTWVSNISGVLGYGPSLAVKIAEAGRHLITLTVRDPDFMKTATVEVVIEPQGDVVPPPPPDDDDEGPGINWLLIAGVVAALVVVGVVLFVAIGKRRTEAYEAEMDARMDAEEKKEALERTRDALKDLADEWEGGSKAEAAGWVAEDEGYEEIEMGGDMGGQLSMEAKVTEGPSEDVAKLWAGVSGATTGQSEAEKEALRIENLKRQYQNAIGRLPYGIPSRELAERDWVVLANSLATGEKKQVEGGREVTNIDGRWYYSDHEDSSTFLKEHGAKKEPAKRKAEPSTDKEKLLAKLEERFILGEITEETYKELKQKYSE